MQILCQVEPRYVLLEPRHVLLEPSRTKTEPSRTKTEPSRTKTEPKLEPRPVKVIRFQNQDLNVVVNDCNIKDVV